MNTRTEPLPVPRWADLSPRPGSMFVDIDGTLLEFEEHPELVRATADLIGLLRALSDALGGAFAVISGRSLADIDRVFAPWQPPAAGGHGAEVRGATGVRRHAPDAELLERLGAVAEERVSSVDGVWVERKASGLAIHYRTNPGAAAPVEELAGELLIAAGGLLELQSGSMVQELRPSGYDKGLAIDELLGLPPFEGTVPVVVGDDLTDEFAFSAANRAGGHSVLVGARSDTVAMYRLADPAAVRGWLTEALEEVRHDHR